MSEARLEAAEDKGVDVFGFIARFAPLLFLIVLMILFAIMQPRFLSQINLFNVMRQVSITGLLAVGMTFVILTAGIDLSVGSLLAFAGLVAAAVAKGGLENRFTVGEGGVGYGWFAAALAAIAVGLACGWLQGLAITRLKVPPFVVTLGGMSAFRGAALSVRRRRPDIGLPAVVHLVGAGEDRTGSRSGHHLPARGAHRPHRPALHALWPAGLCGRRQSGSRAPVGAQRQSHHHERLCDHGVLRRPRFVRARGAAQFRRSRRRHRLRTDRHRLGGDRRHQPVRRRRHHLRHGDRVDPDRRSPERPRA